jgi:hypothetical protein
MFAILFSFGLLALCTLLFTLAGRWICSYFIDFNAPFFFLTFFSLAIGIVCFSGITALFYTKGKSVFTLLLLLLVLAYFLFRYKNRERQEETKVIHFTFLKNPNCLLSLSFVLFVLFCWFVQFLLDASFQFKIPCNPETLLYSQFSRNVVSTGTESTFTIGHLPLYAPTFLSPYHYLDIWCTAGFSTLFGIPEIKSIHFFTFPLLSFLNILGLCALIERKTAIKFYHPFLALAFLFLTAGTFLPFLKEFSLYNFDSVEPALGLYGEKWNFAISILLGLCLLTTYQNYNWGLVTLLLLPLFYPNFFLPVYFLFPILCLILFKQKIVQFKQIKSLAFLYLAITFALLWFYLKFGNVSTSLLNYTDYKGFNLTSFKMIIAEMFYRANEKPFRSLLLYAPFLLLVLPAIRKKQIVTEHKFMFLLFGLLYFSCLFFWAFLYKMSESRQIYTACFLLLHLLLWLLFIDFIFSGAVTKKILFLRFGILLLLGFSAIAVHSDYFRMQTQYSYSKEFLDKIKQVDFSKNEKILVAYLKTPDEFGSPMEYYTGGLTAAYMHLQPKFYGTVSLGRHEIMDESIKLSEIPFLLQKQDFYLFVDTQKKNNQFYTIEQSQVEFLRQHAIHYVSLSPKSILSEELKQISETVIEDEKLGEKFLILKNPIPLNKN